MPLLFALFSRTLAVAALTALVAAPVLAQTPAPVDDSTVPPGSKFKECHGYIRHVSDFNMRVHCIDGDPSDQSFLYFPHYAKLRSGKSIQITDLRPQTPIHILYTQSLGVKKAYKVFVADPSGRGLYGFRS